jgi:hypothetical protein
MALIVHCCFRNELGICLMQDLASGVFLGAAVIGYTERPWEIKPHARPLTF